MLAGRDPPSGEGHGPVRERPLPRGAGETYLSSGEAARENGHPPQGLGWCRGPGRSEQVGRGGGQGPRGRDLVLPEVDPVDRSDLLGKRNVAQRPAGGWRAGTTWDGGGSAVAMDAPA